MGSKSTASVGQNTAQKTPCATQISDLWGSDAGATLTYADVLAGAIADGVQVDGADPTAIHCIEFDLKPINGEDGAGNVATTSDADITFNGQTFDIDPTGSRKLCGQMCPDGTLFPLDPADFTIDIPAGTVLVISVTYI